MREWVWLGHMIDRVAIIKACASTGRDHICIFKVSITIYSPIAKHYNYQTYTVRIKQLTARTMKSLALFAVVIAVVSAFEHQAQFDSWKQEHGKRYESSDIELHRQLIWESNKNYVDNHNKYAARRFGFTVEMNEFADMVSTRQAPCRICNS